MYSSFPRRGESLREQAREVKISKIDSLSYPPFPAGDSYRFHPGVED